MVVTNPYLWHGLLTSVPVLPHNRFSSAATDGASNVHEDNLLQRPQTLTEGSRLSRTDINEIGAFFVSLQMTH